MDVGWMACGQKTLSHCIPIPNSNHGPDWNIEKKSVSGSYFRFRVISSIFSDFLDFFT
jgi:hypothetical protein